MLYENGPYRVEVGPHGAISVRGGDWLSKYSAAIHNDFLHIHDFARKTRSGPPVPIGNLNMIYAGEILYYLPTYYGTIGSSEIISKPPALRPHLTEKQKKKLIEDCLKRDYDLSGDRWKPLDVAISIVGHTENAITLAEIAGMVAEGTAGAAALSALSIANAFLFPIGGTIAIINGAEFGQRVTGMRGAAYGTTAWAFGDPLPKMPAQFRQNILQAGSQWDVDQHDKAWNDARDSAIREIEADVAKRGVSKKSYQTLLRSLGNDNRRMLVRHILEGFEKAMKTPFQKDAMWSPAPNYPN